MVDSGLDDGADTTDSSVDSGLDDGAARLSSSLPFKQRRGLDGATDDFFTIFSLRD